MENNSNIFKSKCFYFVLALTIITVGLLIFTHYEIDKTKKLVGEVEYYDSLNNYNKIYYDKSFSSLKKENKELYDSLKEYKDQISYLVQFTHEKNYSSGKITTKPTVKDTTSFDTTTMVIPKIARTYEYASEPNDTFQYKLNVNSYTEPNWYSFNVKTKNKFTIVNKEDGNGGNHLTIGSSNGGTVSNVTAFKKEKKTSFWKRFSVGPSATVGYDPINNNFGLVVGLGATFNVLK